MSRWPCDAVEVVAGVPRPAFPPRLVTGPASVLTRCAIRLWTIRGVWPEDTLLGLPWLQWSHASVDAATIEALTRRQLQAVAGVARVLEVQVSRPGTELNIAAKIELEADGELVQALIGDLNVYAGTIPGTWFQILGTGIRPIAPLEVV